MWDWRLKIEDGDVITDDSPWHGSVPALSVGIIPRPQLGRPKILFIDSGFTLIYLPFPVSFISRECFCSGSIPFLPSHFSLYLP